MPDLPFGFSAGDDPDRDRPDKDPDPNSPQNPFGFGGGGGAGFDMSDLGQIFTKLGEMFSGAGGAMSGGGQSGPVNYDLPRPVGGSSHGVGTPRRAEAPHPH